MTPLFVVRRITTQLILFIAIKSSQQLKADQPMPEPNLAQLLIGLENCDLQILHNGRHESNFQHLQFLPTTIFGPESFQKKIFKSFDISKIRIPKCRIIYTIFHSLGLNPFKSKHNFPYPSIIFRYLTFSTRLQKAGLATENRLNKNAYIFQLVFSNDAKLVKSTIDEKYWKKVECSAVVKTTQDGKLWICFGEKSYIHLSLSDSKSTCFPVGQEHNVLQIYHKNRVGPSKWKYPRDTGIAQSYGSDLMKIPQHSNPFNRLLTNYSIDLQILQTMLSNSNSSLFFSSLFYGSSQNKLTPAISLGLQLFFMNDDVWIQTGTSDYSFVTCYSENVITFHFYITPFQPQLWYVLMAAYILLTIALSLYLFKKKLRGSFCPWLYLLGGLLEDGVPILRKLEKESAFRLVFGCWIIVCVLLTNCYNGLMITGLNAPFSASSINSFRDLVCDWQEVNFQNVSKKHNLLHIGTFDLQLYLNYVEGLYGYGDKIENPYPSASSHCFSILSFTADVVHIPKFFAFLAMFYHAYDPYSHVEFLDKIAHSVLNLLSPKQRHFPRNIGKS